MYPPPMTSRCPGISLGVRAPVDDQTLSSSQVKPGMLMGSEPVAMTMSSHLMVWSPSPPVTWTVFLSTIFAAPITTFAP